MGTHADIEICIEAIVMAWCNLVKREDDFNVSMWIDDMKLCRDEDVLRIRSLPNANEKCDIGEFYNSGGESYLLLPAILLLKSRGYTDKLPVTRLEWFELTTSVLYRVEKDFKNGKPFSPFYMLGTRQELRRWVCGFGEAEVVKNHTTADKARLYLELMRYKPNVTDEDTERELKTFDRQRRELIEELLVWSMDPRYIANKWNDWGLDYVH